MKRLVRRSSAWAAAGMLVGFVTPARGEPPKRESDAASGTTPETPIAARGPYVHLFGATAIGRGVRFNNPYRLSTQLGETGESLSLSATYADCSIGVAFGPPDGIQHGGSGHVSVALDGIAQEVVTPGYVALWRVAPSWTVFGRAGAPIVLEPDANVGLELALGGAWFFLSGTALTAELVHSLFYGAATAEVSHTAVPMLSLQAGLRLDYEVLP